MKEEACVHMCVHMEPKSLVTSVQPSVPLILFPIFVKFNHGSRKSLIPKADL